MKNKNTKRQGISLIVLVITIIVMIILASSIILTLSNSGIINKANEAVDETDLAQVKNLAALKWSEAYLDNEEDIAAYILKELAEDIKDIEKYDITVTLNGVDVELKEEVPVEWTENVVAMKDGVPIPKGFVASPYHGERTKSGGLVIYELAEGETAIPSNETQYTSLTTRNQYVWVPVAKEDFTNNFIRQNFGLSSTISNTLETNHWEVVLDSTNMPLATQNSSYITTKTLEEVQAMYASVKEYEGFYISRYEAGIDVQRTSDNGVLETNVYSMMGKIPYTYVPWTKNNAMNEDTNGAVQAARSLYLATNTDYGVVSTLTYGVQWDTVLKWWLDTNAVSSVTNSSTYGNYSEYIISSSTALNDGARIAVLDDFDYILGPYLSKNDTTISYKKDSETFWALSTGALKAAKVNNIYDLAGNMWEWTMEGGSTNRRVIRGGSFSDTGVSDTFSSAANRFDGSTHGANDIVSFRASLYIKK